MEINVIDKVLHETGLKGELQEKIQKIFPSIPLMIATLISLILIIVILYFLAYKPVKKAIKARQEYIQANIDQAKSLHQEMQQKLEESNQTLAKAHQEADKIVQEGINHSNKIVLSYTALARSKSKTMLEEARRDVEKQKQEFFEESKNYIVDAASELSKKILKKSVDEKVQSAMIDEFLKEESNK
ncbi:F0F1 ATP synthase subunit B [Mycoplasmopsis columbina]|uniref:F0F1 ATP synthase subunit B n=1 Tax=Mycoplasmopsis columbina TaxID=114881 RepID=UPI0004A753FD|nr:F0F1 ATP synthase subunit B [Mycoplasmopsis columbina]VEU76695.1 ATP synthase subunit b [Mycoplasmopsis columbina]